MMEAWSSPDPGFNQREYSESEMEDAIANLDEESFEEQSPPRNPFIDDEAAETTDAEEPTHEDDEESDPNDCVVVAQLTEDEANVIEDLEHPIDFDSWSSDDEIASRFEQVKRRRIAIVSDSE